MKNKDKYKTAKERAKAFDKFCKDNTTHYGICIPDCELCNHCLDENEVMGHCEFFWLDMEADDKKKLSLNQLEAYKRFYDRLSAIRNEMYGIREDMKSYPYSQSMISLSDAMTSTDNALNDMSRYIDAMEHEDQ